MMRVDHLDSRDAAESKERRETLLERRARVLGHRSLRYVENTKSQTAVTPSGGKRRQQILQAQRNHRQRNLDYIQELEAEIFRLRESFAALHTIPRPKALAGEKVVYKEHRVELAISITLLLQGLSGQVAPGLFMAPLACARLRSTTEEKTSATQYVSRSSRDLELAAQTYVNPNLLPCLESHDALTRMLLLNFSENIAPTMVTFDGPSNGYRAILLPLACENDLLRCAVLAASANHLRFKRPKLAKLASKFQAAAIQGLSQLSNAVPGSRHLGVKILAVIVVLLLNDTISGGIDFRVIHDMAQSWNTAMGENASSARSELDTFLHEQLEMVEIYVQPMLTERTFIATNGNLYGIFLALESAVRQACSLYSYHIANNMPHDCVEDILKELHDTVLRIPSHTPGESALAWVYFIAAAECLSPIRRTFFAKRLMGIYQRTAFSDVTTAFSVLRQIWNQQSEGSNWTNVLTQMPAVFR